jgi:hypothetical protein
MIPRFQIAAGVPQGSPLSPILFLLCTAELQGICKHPKECLSAMGFSDDMNLLAYSQSTEANCKKLEGVHEELLKWVHKHAMRFAHRNTN